VDLPPVSPGRRQTASATIPAGAVALTRHPESAMPTPTEYRNSAQQEAERAAAATTMALRALNRRRARCFLTLAHYAEGYQKPVPCPGADALGQRP